MVAKAKRVRVRPAGVMNKAAKKAAEAMKAAKGKRPDVAKDAAAKAAVEASLAKALKATEKMPMRIAPPFTDMKRRSPVMGSPGKFLAVKEWPPLCISCHEPIEDRRTGAACNEC